MNHKVATAKIMELIEQTNTPASFTTGQLAEEIRRRLDPGISMRITPKGSVVSHSRYVNNLTSAASIDKALEQNQWIKCEAA